MGETLTELGPGAAVIPYKTGRPYVELRAAWSEQWEEVASIACLNAELHTESQGISKAVLERHYGFVKEPFEGSFSAKEPLDITGHWARVRLLHENGDDVLWTGIVLDPDREIQGASRVRTGMEQWIAYGPGVILSKNRDA